MAITAQTCVLHILTVLVVDRYVVVNRVIIFMAAHYPHSVQLVRNRVFFNSHV